MESKEILQLPDSLARSSRLRTLVASRLYVIGSRNDDESWIYIIDKATASQAFVATPRNYIVQIQRICPSP